MLYTVGINGGWPDIDEVSVEDCLNYFADKDAIEVDTETDALDPHTANVVMLQLGDSKNQFVIDVRIIDILLFKELLETKLCLLQNAKFDYKILKKRGILLDKIYDTMLAECVLFCGYIGHGYSLAALHQFYLSIELPKEERAGFVGIGKKPFTLKQVEYGARDVTNLTKIKDLQQFDIRRKELEYCVNLENQVVKALADIEYNGMLLDSSEWSKVTVLYQAKVAELEKALDNVIQTEPKLKKFKPTVVQGNLFGMEERAVKINYGSPVQIKNICHALGEMVESTNEREIGKLAKFNDKEECIWSKHPFFELLLRMRENSKVVSTYGDSFLNYINPATGRVHTDFWQVKNTGRVGSGNKESNAPNVQNIPAKNSFRNCFKARPGFKWVSIDYSGQELRLMADGSGEPGFIDVLNRGEDLHCYAGEMMFKRPIDKKKDKALRDKAKTINFGKPYGMGPDKLADTLGIPKEEAEDLFRQYAEAFPVLNKWLDDQAKKAIINAYSETFSPCKRKRFYPDAERAKELRKRAKKGDRETWREIFTLEGGITRDGMNSPIQGSGADITKEALVGVRELILHYNERYGEEVAFLICTVHDAIDVEAKDGIAIQFAEEMGQIMIAAGNKYVTKVKMEVDITITDQWQK